MNLVQRVKGDQVTFGDVANTVLSMALREGADSDRRDVVFDTYRENSIKRWRGQPSAAKHHRHTDCEAVEEVHQSIRAISLL